MSRAHNDFYCRLLDFDDRISFLLSFHESKPITRDEFVDIWHNKIKSRSYHTIAFWKTIFSLSAAEEDILRQQHSTLKRLDACFLRLCEDLCVNIVDPRGIILRLPAMLRFSDPDTTFRARFVVLLDFADALHNVAASNPADHNFALRVLSYCFIDTPPTWLLRTTVFAVEYVFRGPYLATACPPRLYDLWMEFVALLLRVLKNDTDCLDAFSEIISSTVDVL
jgi:hypothetical protein